uniref:Uncharacterized protein n=1 Tax=Thermorudis peleae TaxID=1382356 RepID=A0A831WXF5_9BACT
MNQRGNRYGSYLVVHEIQVGQRGAAERRISFGTLPPELAQQLVAVGQPAGCFQEREVAQRLVLLQALAADRQVLEQGR